MKTIKIILSVVALCFIFACKSNQGASKNADIEDFAKFRIKFYSDSIFQVSRIIFPLPGADSDIIYGDEKVEDQENENYLIENNKLFWKKKSWKFIETPVENKEFAVTIEKVDSVMREQIRSRETDLVITLEFSVVDNKWMLSYYSHEWY